MAKSAEVKTAGGADCARLLSRAGALGAALLWSVPVWALHWPWHHHVTAAAAPPVQAVAISLPGAPAAQPGHPPIPQHWDGNTLLLDLTGLHAPGAATLAPYTNVGWPMRIEFRVRPGSVARLEVQGAQRVVFFVPARGNEQLLRLDPGSYADNTPRITLQWSGADGSAP